MSNSEAHQRQIQELRQQILCSEPRDILEFCADFFARQLVADQASSLFANHTDRASEAPKTTHAAMSGFTSPFGANANPFGSSDPNPMQKVIEEEENDAVTSPTTPSFGVKSGSGFRGPFGGDGVADAPPSALRSPPNPEGYPAQYNFGRRTSVSAESLKPVADTYDNWQPPVHSKSQEQLERLKHAIEGNFLFSHLDEEQSAQILGALMEKPIPAKDIKVRQPSPVSHMGPVTNSTTGDYPRGPR